MVGFVSDVARKISAVSSSVARGAEEQSKQLTETSGSLNSLSESAVRSAEKSRDAHANAKKAVEAILKAKESMNSMVSSMTQISGASDSTSTIATDIDGIARETGTLAGSAVEKAARMRISAGGFGVVAQEIRKLSRQCTETAKAMKEFEKKLGDEHQQEFSELITNLLNVARFSNLLGVNAAIEAAHVEGTGNEFKTMTDEIHNLAVRSAESAKTTSNLTKTASSLARNGAALSRDIDLQLEGAVHGARAISDFADEILHNIHEQTAGLEQISRTATQITEVTEKNASGAAESLNAATDLEKQVTKLSNMVNRFKF